MFVSVKSDSKKILIMHISEVDTRVKYIDPKIPAGKRRLSPIVFSIHLRGFFGAG